MKSIKKAAYITVIALAVFIIAVLGICYTGFYGVGHNKSITNISTDSQKLIADSFNININQSMEITEFERNNYGTDIYYCAVIKSEKGIDDFKALNEHIKTYTEKKLLTGTPAYSPVGSDLCCLYNECLLHNYKSRLFCTSHFHNRPCIRTFGFSPYAAHTGEIL